jgi:hypothetical protein
LLLFRYGTFIKETFQYEIVKGQIIRPRKLEAQQLFFLNFKGTPSQEEHKIIFSGLKINKMALSG